LEDQDVENIEMDLKEMRDGRGGLDFNTEKWQVLVNDVMKLWALQNAGKFFHKLMKC
jgi:hypothetical protein